jgi:hypothetical protein
MNLRKLADGETCEIRVPGVCNHDSTTTVLAHIRMQGISGMGLKSPDLLGAHACSACHDYCDRNRTNARLFLLEGMARTQAKLITKGIVTW